ncbi:glycosyltransferase [Synechococcus sp. NB0720_010]|uniref:glycosyltransferase n=1 Tax=Synechococcus sp. NB0720_010 TaxID=2907159 RepID=UPI001FFB0902|nr:glycosyltransferase [Synechococcus sp. NB0720_010]UPH89164.1 glycosyltransferase [Synechococcus sp. NB0720_010]
MERDKFLILFCANNAEVDERKGYRRLVETLDKMKSTQESQREVALVIAGSKEPRLKPNAVQVIALGAIDEENRMRLIYDSCDVAVIPSYIDNLPNVGLEAQACGLPCLCFNNGGTAEIVDHGRSGFVARDDNTEEMARFLDSLVDRVNSEMLMQMRTMSRQRAIELWDERVVARQMIHAYHKALKAERV